ncbi:phage head completion protein [Enterovibrio calviensis]
MRIGLMRTRCEFWDVVKAVNEYGIEEEEKKLLYKCPVAIKELAAEITGDTTRSILNTVQVTMRFSRAMKNPTSSMYLVLDGIEYDILTPPNNHWRLNKYLTFNAVMRNK